MKEMRYVEEETKIRDTPVTFVNVWGDQSAQKLYFFPWLWKP